MTPTPTPAAEHLRAAVGRVGLASATDGELVRRFAAHRDDLAFAELVHRHAPTVYAVCRRHLADPGAADDAFQAVFVLLARKAGTLTHPERVGGWVAGTADRVARTARRRQGKRAARLRPLESVPEPAASPAPPSDLRTILDDELAKLPPHYRAVVLLCDVEGVPRREAASRLGIPTGTLSNRLTRARAVLGRRLLRRGVLVAGGVATGGNVVRASPELLASAVRVALSDSPPPAVLSLLPLEVTPMPRGKLVLLLVGGLVLAGGLTTGVVLLTRTPTQPPPTATAGEPEPPKATKSVTPTTRAMSREELEKMPQPKPRLPADDTGAFGFSPDGRWFARGRNYGGQDAKLSVIDTTIGKEVAAIDFEQLENIPTAVAVSADGKRVFVQAGRAKGGIRVWDVAAKKFEDRQLDIGGVKFDRWRVRLTPDGKTLVGGLCSYGDGKGSFRVWDVGTGEAVRTFDSPHTAADGFCFADGGKAVAALTWTGTPEDATAFVTEWDLATGKEVRRIDVRKAVGGDRGPPLTASLAYTADGKQVAVGGGFRLPEVNLAEVKPNVLTSNYPWSGSVWVFDRESGKLVKTLVDHHHDVVRELHLTADGKKLIVNPTLLSRRDRLFSAGGVGVDDEFVELQQWDAATWELDWVKIVPKAERWKLWNGAAK